MELYLLSDQIPWIVSPPNASLPLTLPLQSSWGVGIQTIQKLHHCDDNEQTARDQS